MALDAVNKIKEAELKADEMVRRSKLEANNIILDAGRESKEILEFAEKNAKEYEKSKLLAASTWAEEYLKENERKLSEEVNKLENFANSSIDEAVKLVISRVLS